MSDLREQLDSARARHQAVRYPGDLAAEICLPMRTRAWRLRAGISLATAAGLAAMIAIALLRPPAPGIVPEPALTEVVDAQATDLSIPGLPQIPSLAVPSADDASASSFTLPGLPAFPSLEDGFTSADPAGDALEEEAL